MRDMPFDVKFCCSLSFQHTLTGTTELVLERLAQRVSSLSASTQLEAAKTQDPEEEDAAAHQTDRK